MEFLSMELIAMILTGIISIVGTLFSAKYKALKGLVKMIGDAVEDDRLTKEEIQAIYKRIKDLV